MIVWGSFVCLFFCVCVCVRVCAHALIACFRHPASCLEQLTSVLRSVAGPVPPFADVTFGLYVV